MGAHASGSACECVRAHVGAYLKSNKQLLCGVNETRTHKSNTTRTHRFHSRTFRQPCFQDALYIVCPLQLLCLGYFTMSYSAVEVEVMDWIEPVLLWISNINADGKR